MMNRTAFITALPARASANYNSVAKSGLHAICARPVVNSARAPTRRTRVSMALFGLGLPEVMVIAGVGILIFGPSKIVELGKDLGGLAGGVKKASAEFKEAMQDSLEEADREIERKRQEKTIKTTEDTTSNSPVASIESTSEKKES